MNDVVSQLYNTMGVDEGFNDPIYFSDQQKRTEALLRGEVGDYYAELLRQAKGDYNEAVRRLADDYRTGYGQGNEKILAKMNDAAKVLDANVGRIGADTQLAMSQAQEDRNLLKKNVETQRTRLTEDSATAMNQLALESADLERDAAGQTEALDFSQTGRGIYSGGVVEREKSDLQARIDSLRTRIQERKKQIETGQARGNEDLDTQMQGVDRAFNRTEQGLDINERRAREDALKSYRDQKGDMYNQVNRPYTGTIDKLKGEQAGALNQASALVSNQFAQKDQDEWNRRYNYK